MENWILHAIAQWESSNTKMNPPASISEIEHVEKVLDFKFPDDYKQLYLVVNGFPDLDWQEHMFCFWPLTMILNEFEESLDGNFIRFLRFYLPVIQ